MNSLRIDASRPVTRRLLFAALYFSEGAPIGYLWWALPTRLRMAEVPIEEITLLTATLALPWTLKFLWAPVVDALRGRRWGYRAWIITAQIAMAGLLVPLVGVDFATHFERLRWFLLAHAFAAATQDVAIDAWCISLTPAKERGRMNGWMQAGMLLGRSLLGGGALVLAAQVGERNVALVLIGAILATLVLVLLARGGVDREHDSSNQAGSDLPGESTLSESFLQFGRALAAAAASRTTWLGLGAAMTAGAAFEGLGVIQGPLLVDRGWSQETIGTLTAIPVVAAMIAGSLLGGWLSDRYGHARIAVAAVLWIALHVCTVAALQLRSGFPDEERLLGVILCGEALGVGLLTASMYALLMDLTNSAIAGTQFSAFMAAGNACEVWAGWTVGQIASQHGYSTALFSMVTLSLVGLVFLSALSRGGRCLNAKAQSREVAEG
jgi:MFS family permease